MNNFVGDNVNNKTSTNHNKHNNNDDENGNVTGMLLNLSQKTTIFVDDQTPTPTRLIKNCEEVGLFEDLCHVNPFEETFRKACEQCGLQNVANHSTILTTNKTTGTTALTDDETSLHTPQVFPQYDVVTETDLCCGRNDNLPKHSLDISTTTLGDTINGQIDNNNSSTINSNNNNNNRKLSLLDKTLNELKPPTITMTIAAAAPAAEITTTTTTIATTAAVALTTTASNINFIPTTIQFVQQPQLIPVTFPAIIQSEQEQQQQQQQQQQHHQQQELLFTSSIKSKPLILPKLSNSQINSNKITDVILNKSTKLFHTNTNKSITTITLTTPNNNKNNNNNSNNNNEPSSASLTPTSQLPIKERLKAILNQSGKSHLQEWPKNNNNYNNSNNNSKIEIMARRRAASSRYRNKIRIEHKELKKHNMELQTENENLKKRIKYLEIELIKLQAIAANNNKQSDNVCQQNLSTQLHIPASTIHLIMNIPKMMIPLDHSRHHGDSYL